MAERGIPHNPDTHVAYLGSWIQSLQADKNEIFRAARDANRAADLLIALEHCKSMDSALVLINNKHLSIANDKVRSEVNPFRCGTATANLEFEMN